jgi:hypothetical protein
VRENIGVASVGVAVAQLQAAASTLAVSKASVGRTIFYYFFLEFGPGPKVLVSVPINPAIKGLGVLVSDLRSRLENRDNKNFPNLPNQNKSMFLY